MNGAQITPRTLTFVKKLVSTFGIGFESGSSVYSSFSSSASESIARHAQATAQDPVFLKLKEQFVEDFDFRCESSRFNIQSILLTWTVSLARIVSVYVFFQ